MEEAIIMQFRKLIEGSTEKVNKTLKTKNNVISKVV
jgi:hypothetical protein